MPRTPEELYAEIAAWPLEDRLRFAARLLEAGAAELAAGRPSPRGAQPSPPTPPGAQRVPPVGGPVPRSAPPTGPKPAPGGSALGPAARPSAPVPRAASAATAGGTAAPQSGGTGEARRLVVLDGSNFLGTVPGFDLASEAAREELITRLQDFAHAHPGARVLVYFDGQRTSVSRRGGVEVRFTPGNKPADFYIVEALRALEDAERTQSLLVTADRALAETARKLGAKVEAPSSFHRRLPGARRSSIGERGLSAAEVADWETYFQQPPDQGKKPRR
jgi:predicted RNA-binding protein with PIN domain